MIWLNGFLAGLLLAAGVALIWWLHLRAVRDEHRESIERDLRLLEGIGQVTTGHFHR